MRANERESLRRRFGYRCGYCGVAESDAGAELTLDHFQPRSRGGSNGPENWVYCCHPCNEFKADYWHDDPSRFLLHPLRDESAEHLVEESDGQLRPLTKRGESHIVRLHLNRPQLVAYRRERRAAAEARQAQIRLIDTLAKLEGQLQDITKELDKLRGK